MHPLCVLAAGIVLLLGASAYAAPSSSSYEKEFQARAKVFIEKQAENDPVEIMNWANQAVTDQHKYALGPIIARLALDPKDEKAWTAYRMLMEVDKGKADRGLYHFSAYYRTRLYFMLKDQLPQDVRDSMLYDVKNYFFIMASGGTENHTFMHRASGYLWSEELPGPLPGIRTDADGTVKDGRWLQDWLRDHTRQFYHTGMGEYDSSTYVCFSAASLSNIYDYSTDPKMRELARACMDWLATSQALKYFHGCNAGPEARGFARDAVNTHTDWMDWLWWGDSARPITAAEPKENAGKFATINLAVSGYRPPSVLTNLATKNVPMPFEARGSKPGYWGTPGNKDQEYLYFNTQYAMTTLYSPEDGVATSGTILPQTTMFKVSVVDKDNVRVFGASNGYHRHFPLEGRTPYDQYHQYRDAALNICYVNRPEDDRTKARSIFGVPLGIMEPVQQDGWYFWQVNKAFIAARPLNGVAAFGQVSDQPEKSPTHRWLISPGTLTGWVVQVGQQPDYRSLSAFRQAVLRKCKLDLSAFTSERTVTFTSLQGDVLKMHHTGGPGGKPEAWTNGKQLSYDNWPVFDSPYVKQDLDSGILCLTDGREMLTIDYSGEWPVYSRGVVKDAIVEKSSLSPLVRHK